MKVHSRTEFSYFMSAWNPCPTARTNGFPVTHESLEGQMRATVFAGAAPKLAAFLSWDYADSPAGPSIEAAPAVLLIPSILPAAPFLAQPAIFTVPSLRDVFGIPETPALDPRAPAPIVPQIVG